MECLLEDVIEASTENDYPIICTMCGKEFDESDRNFGDNCYDIFVNYPSKYDCCRVQLDLCVDCFDIVLDVLIPMCKTNPIVDDDWLEHCCEGNVIHRDWGPGGAAYRKRKEKK